jgi:hypothetical protein
LQHSKNCDNNKKEIVDAYRECWVHSKGVECIPKVDWDDKSKGFKHGGDFLKGNHKGSMKKKMVLCLTGMQKRWYLERTHLKWKGSIGDILEGWKYHWSL